MTLSSPRCSNPLLVGLGLSMSLGACVTPNTPPPPVALASAVDQHRIEVLQTGERYDITVGPSDMGLTPETRSEIFAFASAYQEEGHGALVMSAPSGGDNADAAARAAQQTRLALMSAGIPYAAIAPSVYDASGMARPPIVLSFTRYEAVAPDCRPIWEQDLSDNMHQPYASFGCATQANLAAMIEDPHDLLQPRTMTPRDAARRAVVLDRYRNGQPTGAERSSDEQAAISDVID
jgi:pilus assembly protein CpaD